MKTSLRLLLPLLIFAFTNKSPLVLVDAAFEAVRDISGIEVRLAQNYYILPVIRGNGGGLTLASTKNGSCPLNIIQDQREVSNGLPLKFTPVDKDGIIRVSTDLNVKFSASTICVQSTVWKVVLDGSTGKRFVTTGGVEGNPGASTLSNWFKIEKYENHYKLVFCPTVCDTCRPFCGDIGIYIDNGVRRLALSDKPFKVMFKKV